MGIFSIWNDAYEMQRWQAFLAMMLFLVISLVLNVFGVRALPMLDTIGLYWSVIGMCVVMVTLIYCADGVYQPSKAVFGTFTNDSGWPNSFAFILGMLQSWLTTSSCDAVAHVVEEMPKPYINAPRVMWMQVVTGVATAWPFMVVLLFTLKDFDAVLTSPAGPLGEIYLQVTQSRIGATLLLLISVVAMTFCTQSVGTIVSRMVMSFARDRGFGSYSALLAPVHAKLKSPIMAVMFSSAWVVLFGFICE
jgi:amino acid transporter